MRFVLILLFFIPYQLAMIYSMFMLGSFWAGRKLRGIPDALFMVCGMAVPVMGWLLTMFFPFFGFLIPASLGIMYWCAASRDEAEDAAVSADFQRERLEAQQALARDPGNAAAHWSIAQTYEAEKNYDLALKHYELAHGIDERTVSAHELEDVRDRLAAAARPESENPVLEEKVRADARRARWERRILYMGVALLLANWAWGANLVALMLFLGWFSPVEQTAKIRCQA